MNIFLMLLLDFAMVFASLLVCVLYFTMMERKLMSYIQLRKGPNKVGLVGLLTPISDSLKLLVKSISPMLGFKEILFWGGPLMSFYLLILVWMLYPFPSSSNVFWYGFMYFFCMSSLQVFSLLGSGWGCKSKYTMMGSVRGAAQTMSYELLFVFISLILMSFNGNFSLHCLLKEGFNYLFWFPSLFLLWLLSSLAETNRSPFDFSEGESELVSGFNTEYSSMGFACLFLGEYGQMLFISFLCSLLFMFLYFSLIKVFFGITVALFFVWYRSSFPRFRYDLLMKVAWSYGLVFIFLFLFYVFSM